MLAYLVSFVSGHWQDAGGVSLPANALSPAHSFFYAVGCASEGYCAAVGYYYYFPSGSKGGPTRWWQLAADRIARTTVSWSRRWPSTSATLAHLIVPAMLGTTYAYNGDGLLMPEPPAAPPPGMPGTPSAPFR